MYWQPDPRVLWKDGCGIMEQELKNQQSLECYAHKADVCCCWFLSVLFLGLVGWGPEHTARLAMAPSVCTLWEFCFERRLHWRFFMLNPNWSGGQDRGLFLSLGCLFIFCGVFICFISLCFWAYGLYVFVKA